jgi:hypothetical protein
MRSIAISILIAIVTNLVLFSIFVDVFNTYTKG